MVEEVTRDESQLRRMVMKKATKMKTFEKPILVTRPYLPDLEDYKKGLEEIWANQWLTNNGPVLQRFQKGLSAYLGVPETNLELFVNGTLALELGFYALGLAGSDVITTPFR